MYAAMHETDMEYTLANNSNSVSFDHHDDPAGTSGGPPRYCYDAVFVREDPELLGEQFVHLLKTESDYVVHHVPCRRQGISLSSKLLNVCTVLKVQV